MVDFSNSQEDYISTYSGSDRKVAVIYKGERYMLKFAEKRSRVNDFDTSNVNNIVSEHIACQIAKTIGFDVQETVMGLYHDELVVGCKNFLRKNEILHEFSWYLHKEYDSADLGRVPKLEQIEYVMENDSQLSSITDEAKMVYWEMFVLDALIGNFDRHSGNWGYVVNVDTGAIRPSPVYDCGSSLFPALSEHGMKEVLNSEEEIEKRIYVFPTAALSVGDIKKVPYYEMLSSGYNEDCTDALLDIWIRIDVKKIVTLISEMDFLSDIRKDFYITMLLNRKEKIIDKAYYDLCGDTFNLDAFNFIKTGAEGKATTVDEELRHDINISNNSR